MLKFLMYSVLGCGLLLGYVRYLEWRGIFYPEQQLTSDPSSLDLAFEDVSIITSDGQRLHGWFIPAPDAGATLLFFHGNAGNIQHRLEKAAALRSLGLHVLLVDYRGFGRSSGTPREAGLYRDARASYRYLRETRGMAPEEIIVYGESLGTAVAVDLAAEQPVRALILEGAFSRGIDMAKTIYPFLPEVIFSDIYNSEEKIKHCAVPKLFIHAEQDEVVPLRLGRRLYAASPEPKQFLAVPGSHNDCFYRSASDIIAAIRSFLESLK